jgi:phenylacetate-CoA ligase
VSLEDTLYPWVNAFERLTPRMKVGTAYRHLPARVRLGTRYQEFCDLASGVESWSSERIAAYQVTQLRMVVAHAAKYSPFYGRRFAEAGFKPEKMTDLADFEACPYVTKTDMANELSAMVATKPSRSARLYVTTGGSTGTPVGFYLHKGVSRPKEQAFLEAHWKRAGYFAGARLAVIRGRVTTPRSGGNIAYYDTTRDWLMLSSFHLTAERLSEYLTNISCFRPDILHAYPSTALQLARLLDESGERWPLRLRCVLAGSERLTTPQRHLLEQTFECPIYHWYGHRERVVLAGEGRKSDLLYFSPTYGYVEFGPPDDEGLCEVIGTSFHNLVMPLVRYRTGDYVRLYDAGRDGPKEFDWPAVQSVEGRGHEFLMAKGGRKIPLTPLNVNDPSLFGLYAVQFFQDEPGRAELRYVPGPRFNRDGLPRIAFLIGRKLGDDFVLTIREVSEVEKTERGKGKLLVSSLVDLASKK